MELSTEERNSLIKDYFTKGLTQKEIRNILMCRNHIVSLVHLKRLGPVVQLVAKFQPMVKNENLWLKFNQSTQCVVQLMVKFNYWLKHG